MLGGYSQDVCNNWNWHRIGPLGSQSWSVRVRAHSSASRVMYTRRISM